MSDYLESGALAEREPLSVTEVIPLAERRRKTAVYIAIAAASCIAIWGVQYSSDQLADCWWYAWPIALICGIVALKERYTGTKTVLTERGTAVQAQQQRETEHRHAEFFNRRWIRYPAAVLIVWFAVEIWTQKPGAWWLALLALLYAAWFAREVAGVAIVLGGIYLLFQGIAALPVSVAIVIGALIIASALRK